MLWAMAWRNLWRHRRRTLITAGALATSMAFVLGLFAYMDGAYRAMGRVMVEEATGHVQVQHPEFRATRNPRFTVPAAAAAVAAVRALEGTRAVSPRLEGYALVGGADKTAGALILGVDPAVERPLLGRRIRDGTWLADTAARQVVVGASLARSIAVGVGDEVVVVTQAADGSIGNDLYRVVGVVESGTVTQDRGAWLHLADLQELLVLPDQVHQLVVVGSVLDPRRDDPETVAEVAAVQAVVGPGVEVIPWWTAAPSMARMLALSDATAWIMLSVVFGVAGLGVLNTMLMSVFERTRELGVMKALGTRPGRIVRLVLAESLLLGLFSVLGGLVLGGLLDLWLVHEGLRFASSSGERISTSGIFFDPVIRGVVLPERILTTVVFLLGVAVLAALWPALRAAFLRPVDAMRDR